MFEVDKDTNNITLTRGDSFALSVAFVDYELETGDVVKFTVASTKEAKNYGQYIIEKSITEFTEEGFASIKLDPSDTENLNIGSYYYDIEVITKDDVVGTPIVAKFTLTEGVRL